MRTTDVEPANRKWTVAILLATVFLLCAQNAKAAHDRDCTDPQDRTIKPELAADSDPTTVADLETYIDTTFNGQVSATLCLRPAVNSVPGRTFHSALNPGSEKFEHEFYGFSHLTIRAGDPTVPNERIFIDGAVKVHDSADQVYFLGLYFNANSSPTTGLPATFYLNGEDLVFDRVNMSQGDHNHRVSCVHTSNSSGSSAISIGVEIKYSRIYGCGEDGEHDHCIYLGYATHWSIHDNFIYECGSRVVAAHNNATNVDIYENVISQGCQKHQDLADYRCAANVTWSRTTNDTDFFNNVVAYARTAANPNWNARPGGGEFELTGLGNAFNTNCVWTYDGQHGIHQDAFDGPDTELEVVGNITSSPDFKVALFDGFKSPVWSLRNYYVGNGPGTPAPACESKDPDLSVGAF